MIEFVKGYPAQNSWDQANSGDRAQIYSQW